MITLNTARYISNKEFMHMPQGLLGKLKCPKTIAAKKEKYQDMG